MTSMIRQTLDDISVKNLGKYCRVHCNVDVVKGCPSIEELKGFVQSSRTLGDIIRLGSKQNNSMPLTMRGMVKLRI